MTKRKAGFQSNSREIRNWTLYVVKFNGGHYYVGITSRKNTNIKINQHGGPLGAKVNRGKKLESIIDIRHLGRMTGKQASDIENDVTLVYRKKFGAHKVRGGYDIYKTTSLIPAYTPGSKQSIIFIVVCLVISIALLMFILIM